MKLVPYAGSEIKPSDLDRQAAAYRLFKQGNDTHEISRLMRVREPVVYRWINDTLTANYHRRQSPVEAG